MPEHDRLDDEPICDVCAFGHEEVNKMEKKNMEEFGWVHHAVVDDPDTPFNRNFHTHGLPHTYGHPDLQICLFWDRLSAHQVMWNIVHEIENGKKFKAGDLSYEIITDYPVKFVNAKECDRDVLRVIFPDKQGKLDKEDMEEPYDKQYEGTF